MTSELTIRPVVIVPVHLARPSPTDIVSLQQCGKVLGSREIVLVSPQGLNLTAYRELLPSATELRVEPHWMSSIEAYNRMMISPRIVNELDGYTHMLIHEPDAIVLRDELDYWCRQPHDYIGAPWFEGFAAAAPDAKVIGVGNSGFSLHRLDALRRVVTSRKRWYPYQQAAKDLIRGLQGSRDRFHRGTKALGRAGQLRGAWELYDGHCDAFWSHLVPQLDTKFKIASIEESVHFSWELLPARCFQMTHGKLPFGIHAWAKYDLEFVAPHLLTSGVDCHQQINNLQPYYKI